MSRSEQEGGRRLAQEDRERLGNWQEAGRCHVFLRSRMLGEGAGIDVGGPGDPPRRDFWTIFRDSLCHFGQGFHPNSVQILSKFQISQGSALGFSPWSPGPSVEGAAVSA